jgi:two-component system sensor histidine kinase MtrB
LVADRVAVAIERARLHEQMVQLDELRANFIAIASHELRTPATSVYGVLTTLLGHDDHLDDSSRRELLRVGVEQGERLRRLLEELLDLSRLDARGIDTKPRPLVLARALGEIASETLPTGGDVDLDIPDDLVVVADRLVLDRVISNLLSNAVRHGAEPIRLSAEAAETQLRISVEDSGAGVAEDMRLRLFDRFSRTESATAGSGLGLAIARTYARAHGGDLVHDQRARGARFTLIIPQDLIPDQQTAVGKPDVTS